WIRDGATMAAALLRVGSTGEVRDYIRWYAAHQAPDGTVPCCVDRSGPDWLAEYDSQGELIYAVMEHFRFTRDRAFLADMWPAVPASRCPTRLLPCDAPCVHHGDHDRPAHRLRPRLGGMGRHRSGRHRQRHRVARRGGHIARGRHRPDVRRIPVQLPEAAQG